MGDLRMRDESYRAGPMSSFDPRLSKTSSLADMETPVGPMEVEASGVYGPRLRVGLIVPATNTTSEPDFVRVLPDNVTVHAARVWLPETSVTSEVLDRMNQEVDRATRHLAEAGVDIVAYASTVGSFYRGGDYETSLKALIESIAGVPAVTTATAVTDALRHLRINTVSVATPYNDWENERLRVYLQENGFYIVNIHGDPAGAVHGGRGHSNLSPKSAYSFAETVWDERADGMFCACTAWRALEIVSRLESNLGIPVVTANQATLWAVAKALSINLNLGYGTLLEGAAASQADGLDQPGGKA